MKLAAASARFLRKPWDAPVCPCPTISLLILSGIDQKEVIMVEVVVGVALLAWTVLVLLTTGDETV